jgi:hypothetical protein
MALANRAAVHQKKKYDSSCVTRVWIQNRCSKKVEQAHGLLHFKLLFNFPADLERFNSRAPIHGLQPEPLA